MKKKHNWFVRPGVVIADLMEEKKLTEAELADAMDIAENKLVALIKGEAKVCLVLATILTRELGGTVNFWLQLQFNADHLSTTPELSFGYTVLRMVSTTNAVTYTSVLYLNGKRIHSFDDYQTEEEATQRIRQYLCALSEAVDKAL